MVNGAWWAAVAQPVILSIGSLFAANNLDLDLEPMLDFVFTFKTDREDITKEMEKDISDIENEDNDKSEGKKSEKELLKESNDLLDKEFREYLELP